jgi:hypothetical protein
MIQVTDRWRAQWTQFRATAVLRVQVLLVTGTRRIRSWLGQVAITLFGCLLAAFMVLNPAMRRLADAFSPVESVLTQLGVIYGTILALVLTLSIIPIQRAAEALSPSVVRIYRQDPGTYLTFLTLGLLCVGSFALTVRGIPKVPTSLLLAGSLATLAASLDLLRWFHSHVCQLLEQRHAVTLSLTQAQKTVDNMQRTVARIARLQHRVLPVEQRKRVAVEEIESVVYQRMPGRRNALLSWINDLTEIAAKATARGEKSLARSAVASIATLIGRYLDARKNNLVLVPAPEAMYLAEKSDVNEITDRAYEALQETARVAIRQGDETTAINVVEAYKSIAIHAANLGARAFREHSSPLTFAPIHYALECSKYAQSKGLDEVPFQAAPSLAAIVPASPKDVSETDICVPVVDGLAGIALYLYGKRQYALAEEVNGHLFTTLKVLLERRDYYFEDMLRHVLEKVESLAPLALVNEALSPRLTTTYPLHKVYGLANRDSLAYLFARAAEILPAVDADRAWLNPYRDLVDLMDVIAKHLRKIAESSEFGASFLLWEVDQLIKQLAKVLVALVIDKPLRPERADEQDVIDKFKWILAFYWVAFKGKKTVSEQRADDCAESLSYIGLLFYARGHVDVLRTCATNISSILESYCETTKEPDKYVIGDLLAHVWGIRLVLAHRGDAAAALQEVDNRLQTKPRSLADERWQQVQEAILLRRRQLEERLEEDAGPMRGDDGEDLLRRLLGEVRPE